MIRLDVSERARSLRAEFRAWLASHVAPFYRRQSVARFIHARGALVAAEAGGSPGVGVHWPKRLAAVVFTLVEEAVVQEEGWCAPARLSSSGFSG